MGQAITHSDFVVLLAPGSAAAAGAGASGGFDDDEEENGTAGGAAEHEADGDADAESRGAPSAASSSGAALGPSGQEQQQQQQQQPDLPPPTAAEYQAWVEAALALTEFTVEKRSKSNPKKVNLVDLRPTLLEARVCASAGDELRAEGDAAGAAILDAHLPTPLPEGALSQRSCSI